MPEGITRKLPDGGRQVFLYGVDRLFSIDLHQVASFSIMIEHWRCLRCVYLQAVTHRFRPVILTSDQIAAAVIALVGCLRFVESIVVRPLAIGAGSATRKAAYQLLLRDFEKDRSVYACVGRS